MSLKEQLAEYRAGWYQRVPAERQAIMQRHIDQLRSGAIARNMLKVGDHAPAIVLENAKGATVDVGTLLKKGPVIVTFYRGGWCPYCNLELKAYQEILPQIVAAGVSLVAIAPRSPTTRYRPRKRMRSPSKSSEMWARTWDEHSAWSTNSPKNSRVPTTGSIWISRPAMERRANGRCQCQRPTLSTVMARSSTRTRMSTIATAPIPVMFYNSLRKRPSRPERDWLASQKRKTSLEAELDRAPTQRGPIMSHAAQKKTAFVFAGGGSLGAVQVGMLRALMHAGVSADFVVGSSVGAMNAAYFAGAPNAAGVDKLEKIWRGLRRHDVFPLSLRSVLGFMGGADNFRGPQMP